MRRVAREPARRRRSRNLVRGPTHRCAGDEHAFACRTGTTRADRAMRKASALIICVALLAAGAPVPAAPGPSLGQALADMDRHYGRRVQWGGLVAALHQGAQGSWVEVLAYPLDGRGRPRLERAPVGRFLVHVPGPLDPRRYQPGRAIAVEGVVKAEVAGEVGGKRVRLPVLRGERDRLWTVRRVGPARAGPARVGGAPPPGYGYPRHAHGGYEPRRPRRPRAHRHYDPYLPLLALGVLGAVLADGHLSLHHGFGHGHGRAHRRLGLGLHFHD